MPATGYHVRLDEVTSVSGATGKKLRFAEYPAGNHKRSMTDPPDSECCCELPCCCHIGGFPQFLYLSVSAIGPCTDCSGSGFGPAAPVGGIQLISEGGAPDFDDHCDFGISYTYEHSDTGSLDLCRAASWQMVCISDDPVLGNGASLDIFDAHGNILVANVFLTLNDCNPIHLSGEKIIDPAEADDMCGSPEPDVLTFEVTE